MWKVFDAKALSALLSTLSRAKQAADSSASAVSGLGEDLVELSRNTTQTLSALNQELANVQAAVDQLRQDLADGTAAVKPVFPVVSADPASPREGEAWIKT